jgi:hypothetical protein
MKFPEVQGSNLEGKEYNLPYDLEQKLNLLIVPFRREQQVLVNEWSNFLRELIEKYSFFEFYEIPTLAKGYILMRFAIDGGMKAGIANKRTRERTITIYINKRKFKKQLQIQNENLIYLFLVNREGEIYWKEQGQFNEKKGNKLEKILKDLIKKESKGNKK